MPLYSLKVQTLATRWKHFCSSSSTIFVDDAVLQWVLYYVCGHKKNNGTMGLEILEHPPYGPDLAPSDFHLFPNMKKNWPGSGTFGLSSLPQHEKNIFMPSDSNHTMMSSLRCKHGCVVRIPSSIDRVLRNGFPA